MLCSSSKGLREEAVGFVLLATNAFYGAHSTHQNVRRLQDGAHGKQNMQYTPYARTSRPVRVNVRDLLGLGVGLVCDLGG